MSMSKSVLKPKFSNRMDAAERAARMVERVNAVVREDGFARSVAPKGELSSADREWITQAMVAAIIDVQRHDSASTATLTRELKGVAGDRDVLFRPRRARDFVPISDTVDPGAETFTYHVRERVGAARMGATYDGSSPRVDVVVGEGVTGSIKTIRSSYGWTVQDVRRSVLSRHPLPTWRGEACKEAFEDAIDEVLATGANGLTGLINNAEVTVYSTDGAGGSTTLSGFTGGWGASATAKQMVADVHLVIKTGHQATNEAEFGGKVSLLVPPTAYDRMASEAYSTENEKTALEILLAHPRIASIDSWGRLTGVGVSSRDRAIFYTRSAEKLEGIVPLDFTQLPPQREALEYIVECEARVGGVAIYYPKSVVYLDGV